MASLNSALLAFASALVIAALTAVFAYWRYTREQKHQRTTLLNALFAELANIFEHYTYAAFELPVDTSDTFELKKRLRWSRYGGVRSTSDVGKLGFLDAPNIKALLQLELRIRNDNVLLDQLLECIPDLTSHRLHDTRNRLRQRVSDADWLLKKLVAGRPRLERVFVNLKKELPSIGADA
jgi:hypothetical protein